MTETQAQSGSTGTSTTPVEVDPADAPEPTTGSATGRAVVGRASVPADGGAPKFSRPEGITPPPDSPYDLPSAISGGEGAAQDQTSAVPTSVAPATSSWSGSAPVTKAAPATGRATAGVASVKPAGSRQNAGPGGTKVGEAARAVRATVSSAASRGPRRARLFVKRIDPWSVMKFSFAVSFVLFFVAIVATAVLYLALDAMGVFDSVNRTLADLIVNSGGSKGSNFKITAFGVIGTAGVLGLVNVVLFTALATLSAFIYNVCADLVGGIEVTLSEKD